MLNEKEENNINTPRKGPMMRGPGMRGARMGGGFEKPKDFKTAIKRLFKELNNFRSVIIFALILAIISALLSIYAPSKLSDLTDKISDGLIVNQDNIKEVSEKVTSNLDEDKLKKIIPNILNMNLSEENVAKIMIDDSISNEDKLKFREIISNLSSSNGDNSKMFELFSQLPDSILNVIFEDSIYDNHEVTVSDKKALLNMINGNSDIKNIIIPKNIVEILFKEIQIDGVKISSQDQYEFLKIMSNMQNSDNIDVNELYSKIEELPDGIKQLIEPKMDLEAIKNITIFLVCIYVISALFSFIQSLNMTNVANKFAKELRSRISIKINKLPLKYFDKHQSGDTLSRVTNDVDTIAQSMNQSLGTLVTSVTLFLGSVIMMFVTNWIMALTAIFSSIIGFLGMMLILKNSQKYFNAKQTELGNLNAHIEEIYSGINVVKVYNGKRLSDEKFDEYNKKVCESNRKSQFLSGLMQPIMGFIGNFGYVAVCIVGALLAMNDVITFGVIVAFITYVRLFTNPLSQIAQALTSLQSTAAASERVFEFIDEEEMPSQDNMTINLDKNKVKGDISFENVMFKYDDNEKPTIKNFTAEAKPGQKVAIVGPTGAGKTTMVNLLMKFYDINSGDIKIDGVSTKDLTRENIHELFTMVLQDTWSFDGTIKENIIYNRKNISDERVKEVCKRVGLHHFIKTLPHGYDSKLSESDSISAGQRQLLTIARGMIEDAPFLILDEATSNVDTRTEELVQKAMDELTKGKTSFIIAHRLSTIKNADLILVMKDGNIIEQGSHDELMNKNGAYAELYNSQFEL